MTIALSSLVCLFIYLAGKKQFHHTTAALAAFLAVINKSFIYRSLQGLRLELFMLGILILIILSLKREHASHNRLLTTFLLGITCGLLALTRTSGIFFVVPLLVMVFVMKKYTLRETLCAAALFLLLLIPVMVNSFQTFGQLFYSNAYHLNSVYHMTTLKIPAPDTTTLPFMRAQNLIVNVYGIPKTLMLMSEGMMDMLFARFALRILYIPFSVIIIMTSILSYCRWLWSREKLMLLIMLFFLAAPLALPLAMFNHSPMRLDWRLVAHLFPFIAWAGIDGLFFLWKVVHTDNRKN